MAVYDTDGEVVTPSDPRVERLYRDVEAALYEFADGRAAAFQDLYSHADDVTIFGGFGGYEHGWDVVGPRLAWAASMSGRAHPVDDHRWQPRPGSDKLGVADVSLVLLHAWFGTEFGGTVWLEQARPDDDGEVLSLRATHLYRLENEQWKIVHRHADPLVVPTRPVTLAS